MFCKKCGAQLEDDALFCTVCGEKLNVEENRAAEIAGGETMDEVTLVQNQIMDHAPSHSLNPAYMIGIVAYVFTVLSSFLPFISIKALGFELAKTTLFESCFERASWADILLLVGFVLVGILVFTRNGGLRAFGGMVAVACIGYPIYDYLTVSQSLNLNLEIGGILFIIAGVVLVISLFIPVQTQNN